MINPILKMASVFVASKAVDAGVSAGVNMAIDAFKATMEKNSSQADKVSSTTDATNRDGGPETRVETRADFATSDNSIEKK